MQINEIIKWFSLFIWLLPPFRQYGGKYFKYFLVLALIDPVTQFIYHYIIKINPLNVFIVFSCLLIYSLLHLKGMVKSTFLVLLLLITLSSGYPDAITANIIVIVLHLFILSIIMTQFVRYIGKEQCINFFLIALFLYETTIIIKMYFFVIKAPHYPLYYFITTGFEILLALFFITFRSDDKRINARLYSSHTIMR